jgi:predicted DNA repair protein MutK
MVGGFYLCFEAVEKIWEAIADTEDGEAEVETVDAAELERKQVSGAIRTDFILSAEIMAIALASLPDEPLLMHAAALAGVAVAITAGVYGVVAVIVKMDDVGLHYARSRAGAARKIGCAMVRGMPKVLQIISTVGIAAMAWVGGGFIVHGLEAFGLEAIGESLRHLAEAAGETAAGAAVVGLLMGGAMVAVLRQLHGRRG